MSAPDAPQDPQQQINIELPEGLAEGTYSNLVMIAHSAEEFILDFIRVMPGLPKARVKSRIIVTPQHAKRFLRALADNIDRYEHNYGPIEEQGEINVDQFHFGGPSAEA